jgi:hypothetical protein
LKICDRCQFISVVETIVKCKTEEEIDLCEKCLAEFEEFRKPKRNLTIYCHDCKQGILEKDSFDFPVEPGVSLMLCKNCFTNRNKPKVAKPRKDEFK